jgi:Translationally controlled tumour protein
MHTLPRLFALPLQANRPSAIADLENFSISQSSCEILPADAFWQDIITGDEIISDSYDLKEVDGVAYEVNCRKITVGNENIGPPLVHYLYSCGL